jgi:hypothetical protein
MYGTAGAMRVVKMRRRVEELSSYHNEHCGWKSKISINQMIWIVEEVRIEYEKGNVRILCWELR